MGGPNSDDHVWYSLWGLADLLDRGIGAGEELYNWAETYPNSKIAFVTTWSAYCVGDVGRGVTDIFRTGEGIYEKGPLWGTLDDSLRILSLVPAFKSSAKIPETVDAINTLCKSGKRAVNKIDGNGGPCVMVSTAQAITHSGQKFIKPAELHLGFRNMSSANLESHINRVLSSRVKLEEEAFEEAIEHVNATLRDLRRNDALFKEMSDDVYDNLVQQIGAFQKDRLKTLGLHKGKTLYVSSSDVSDTLWQGDDISTWAEGLKKLEFDVQKLPLNKEPESTIKALVGGEDHPIVVFSLMGEDLNKGKNVAGVLQELRKLPQAADPESVIARAHSLLTSVHQGHCVYAFWDRKDKLVKICDAVQNKIFEFSKTGFQAIAKTNRFQNPRIFGNALRVGQASKRAKYTFYAKNRWLVSSVHIKNVQLRNYWHFDGYGLFPSLDGSSGSASVDDKAGFLLRPGNPYVVSLKARGKLPWRVANLLEKPRMRYVFQKTDHYFGRFDTRTGRRIQYVDVIDGIPIQMQTSHK